MSDLEDPKTRLNACADALEHQIAHAAEDADGWFATMPATIADDWKQEAADIRTVLAALTAANAETERLKGLLNAPEVADFMVGVMREAAHQRERWGTDDDAGKTPMDWFWLLGYLAGKSVQAANLGDIDKALHHTISSAAALANWHAALSGTSTTMRPGISPPLSPEEKA